MLLPTNTPDSTVGNYGRVLKQPSHPFLKHTRDCGHPIPVYLPSDHNNDLGGTKCCCILLYSKHQINRYLSITLPPPMCLCVPQFPRVLSKLNGFLFHLFYSIYSISFWKYMIFTQSWVLMAYTPFNSAPIPPPPFSLQLHGLAF